MHIKRVLITVLIVAGCGSKRESSKTDNSNKESQLIRNGVFLNHKQCGNGELTLLFVHGWCIDQSYWSDQINTFCENYKLVTLDLPGFGNSGKNRTDWSIEEYGKDIGFLIKQLELNNVVLIGHSMGGDVILEAALQNEKVIALIGIDNFKDVGAEFSEEVRSEIDAFITMLEENFSQVAPAFAEGSLFHSSTDSLVKRRVMNDFGSADSLAAVASLQSLFEYSSKETDNLSMLSQKLYLINSDATPTNTTGLDKTGVDYEVIEINATGHYPMIEKPEIFNQLLKQVIQKIEETR